jgi:pimeloyl-ACP methyl ester carboxylesterase
MLTTLTDGMLFRESDSGSSREDRAVVFIHGFTGDATNTWKADEAQHSFSALLALDPEFADHDVLLFQYESRNLNPPSIPNIARQLLFVLEKHGYGRIIFIAHSMGGLVAMECVLLALESDTVVKVAGMLLYGVPMNGVEWLKYAQLLPFAAGLVHPWLSTVTSYFGMNRQLKALTRDSEFIQLLTGRWVRRVLNGGDPRIPAAQRAAFPVCVVSGNDDWVVRESSARGLYGEIDWINVDEDHRKLVKPAKRSALTYQIAANFLKQSRAWAAPNIILKLRGQIDQVWSMREQEVISNWSFDLDFDDTSDQALEAAARTAPELPEFSAFRVLRCEYKRRIPAKVLNFGFAVGHLAAGEVWNDTFVFLHRTSFSSLSQGLTNRLENALRAVLATDSQQAWDKLFKNVQIRVEESDGSASYHLVPGAIKTAKESLIREYSLPSEAEHLCGKEAVIHVSFGSIRPSASCDYTAVFPWLCDRFTINVSVQGQPTYLLHSSGMRGTAAIQSNRQHETKLQCSSADLILPGSTLQFDWGFR